MLEVTLIFLVMISIATTAFLPLGLSLVSADQDKLEKSRHISLFEQAETSSSNRIPEDSTLKRHFLTHLRAEIVAHYHDRPTDSALRRHYDAMINAEVEKKLEELKA